MKEWFILGKIVKAIGLKGRVKVYIYHNIQNFLNESAYYLGKDKKEYKVKKKQIYQNNSVCMEFEEITSKEKAQELLIGKEISVFKEIILADDEFYYKDIPGVSIYIEESFLGIAMAAHNFGGGELLECTYHDIKKEKNRTIILPLRKELIQSFDLKKTKTVVYNQAIREYL